MLHHKYICITFFHFPVTFKTDSKQWNILARMFLFCQRIWQRSDRNRMRKGKSWTNFVIYWRLPQGWRRRYLVLRVYPYLAPCWMYYQFFLFLFVKLFLFLLCYVYEIMLRFHSFLYYVPFVLITYVEFMLYLIFKVYEN